MSFRFIIYNLVRLHMEIKLNRQTRFCLIGKFIFLFKRFYRQIKTENRNIVVLSVLLLFLPFYLHSTVEADSSDFQLHLDSGKIHIEKGNYSAALQHYFNALKISENENSDEKSTKAHSSLGTTYYRLKDWDKALKHLDIAEELSKKTKNENDLADIYYKKGIVYDELPEQTNTAYSYLRQALSIYQKDNDCQTLADIFNALAGHFYMQRKTDSVTYYAKLALEKFEECGTVQQQAAMNINIAALLNSQYRHKEAVLYNNKGIELARSINSYAQLRQGYKNLSETYAYMNQFDSAYIARTTYDQYKDSVYSSNQQALIEELSIKYENEKKDLLIAEQNLEIDNHRLRLYTLFSLLFGALILIGFLYYVSIKRKKINLELRELNNTKDKLFSIISHDLKAPIVAQQKAIGALVKNVKSYDEVQLVENLHHFQISIDTQLELLQNLLSWANVYTGRIKYNPVGFNISEIIQETVSLYELPAQNKEIKVKLNLPKKCYVYADRNMVQTVIRNLINNAIKFTEQQGEISLSCTTEGDKMTFSIKDNGVGMSDEVIASAIGTSERHSSIGTMGEVGSGLGFIICREFLERNNSKMEIISELGKGTEISFQLQKADTTL